MKSEKFLKTHRNIRLQMIRVTTELNKTGIINKEDGIPRAICYNCSGIIKKNKKFLKIYENVSALIKNSRKCHKGKVTKCVINYPNLKEIC